MSINVQHYPFKKWIMKKTMTIKQVACWITMLTEIKISFILILVTLIVQPHSGFFRGIRFKKKILILYIQIECFSSDNHNIQWAILTKALILHQVGNFSVNIGISSEGTWV